ncbi:not1 amine-terminal ccr4-not complex component, partial [Cystoisospora suis]
MALKRLHTEVDKTVREVRACLDTYDERWQELLEFNRQFVQRKEQLVDEARKEVIRGKKHSVRTATLELMDYKHVNDAKAKIEADLEGALRKLHRHKQQLSDWIHNYSDKDIRNKDALTELRKCIELRYKRGRVFYSQGQSSFPVSGPGSSQGGLASSSSVEAVQWMPSLIEALSGQIETWEGELLLLRQGKQCGTHSSRSTSGSTATSPEARSSASSSGRSSNAKGRNSRRGGTANAEDASSVCGMAGTSLSQQKEGAAVGERIAQLSAMVELHRLHIDHLERLLRAVRREELAGDDERLEELRDVLDPYVHSNSNMVIVVPEEIYQDLELQESLPGTCIAPVETAVGRPCAHDEDGKREPSRAHQTGPGTSASSCDNCEAPLAGMNDTGTQISVIDTRKRSRTRAKDEMDQVVAGESSTKDCRGRTHCPDGSGQGHLNVRSSPVSASSGAEVRAGGGGSSSAPAPSGGATPWGTGASGGGGEGGGWMAGEVAREKNEEGEPTSFSATSKGTVKRGPGEAWGRGSGPKKSSALETRRVSDEASTAGKPRGFRSAAPHAGGSAKASSFAAAAAAAAKLSASSSVSSPGNSLQGSDFSSRPSAVLGIPPRSVPIATPVAGNGSSVGVSCWGGGRAQSASSQRNQREVSPPAEGVLSSSPRPSGTSRPPGWVKGQSFSAAWVTERGDGNSRKLRGRQMEGDSFRSLLGSDGVGDSIQGTAPSSDGQKTPSAGGCSSTAASSSEAESGQPESVETISSPVEGSKANGRRLSSRSGNDTPAKGLEGNSGPSHQSRPLTPARSGGRVRGYAEVLTSSPTTASSSVLLSPAVGEKFPALGNAGVHMSRSRDGDQTSKEGGQRVEERKDMRPASDGRGSISSTGGQAFAGWNGLPAARRASGTGTSGGLFSPSKQEVPDGEICGAWPRSRRLGCDVGMEGASGTGVSNEEGRLERKMVSASRASPGEAPLTVWKRSRRSSGGDSSTREISEGPRGEDEESNPGESQGATSPGTASTRAAANRGRAEILPSLGLRRGTLYGSRDGSSGDEEVSQARAGSITKSDLRFFPISGMREHEDALLAVSRSNPERCEERKTVDCMPVGGGGRDGHVLGRDLLEEREFQWLSKEDFQQPEGSADFSGDYSSPSFPNLSSRSVGSPVRGGEVLQWLPSSGALSDYPREPAFSLLGVPFSSDTPPLFSSCVLPRSSP